MLRRLALPASLVALAACMAQPREPRASRTIDVVPPPVAANDAAVTVDAESAVADDSEWIRPCVEGTDDHKAALARLASVSKAIHDLPAGAPHEAVAKRLTDLVKSPCFTIGTDLEMASIDSALSLKTYWQAGGESALEARLAWGKPADRWLWLTPSFRKALTTESAPKHPLVSLLCPADPGTCGAETAGWVLRAEAALELRANADRASFLGSSPPGDPPKTYESCKAAAAAAPDQAFTKFSRCMEQTALEQDALPLGKFRAPKDGWLVLRGRRGHHAWCNELRAYDLATGAAYVASTCGGMFAPHPQVGIRVEKGRLPIDALREATWMMLIAEAADHAVVVNGSGRFIPNEITIRTPAERSYGIGGSSSGTSSGRTTLIYQWIRAGKSVATGTVSWPDAYHAAEEHATSLLAVAEAGMRVGCAPAALPAIPWSARSDVTTRVTGEHSYFPNYDEPEFSDLEREIAKAGLPGPPCPSAP